MLSVSQFVISLFFITTAILVFNQFKHFISFEYGFTTKNIINVELQGQDHRVLTNELLALKDVTTISASDIIPATGRNNGMQIRQSGTEGEYRPTSAIRADEHFISNLDLKVIAGKFTQRAGSDRFIVINEQAVKELGYTNPPSAIGQLVEINGSNEVLEIVGVIQNFRFKLLVTDHVIQPWYCAIHPISSIPTVKFILRYGKTVSEIEPMEKG